jgi:glycosyltransferase involved in cell wall biosynthesis
MPSDKPSGRLLILIVAYNAECTLEKVLQRIPPPILQYDYRILIIDDSSGDNTVGSALAYKERHPQLNMEVLSNPENQGYGGNQKIGYQYAIEQGFDAVVLVHGDGQYAPEVLEALISPVLKGEAEAVMGTRMAKRFEALRGGMPLYKYAGNKILTGIQNRLLGTGLSEFHSGYRVYSVNALRQIPFQYNTNDFHFDTEMIIQFLLKHFRIQEIPIPTYYGDEICYVNGFKYAWNVIKTTVTSVLNRMDIGYDRKYDIEGPRVSYDLKLGYPSSHTWALDEIAEGVRVLDVGCGEGLFAEKLTDKGCTVHGLDRQENTAGPVFSRYTQMDFDRDRIRFSLEEYDVICLLDIIEHLDSPETLLDDIRTHVNLKASEVIITVPNVAFFPVRFGHLLGRFQYGKRGILDLSHRRLFTFPSLRRLLEQCGYKIMDMKGIPAPYPKAIGLNGLSRALLAVNLWLIKVSRGLFSYQIFVKAMPLPTVRALLERTKMASQHLSASKKTT